MVLAFIQDPLQTIFTWLMAVVVVTVYTIIWSVGLVWLLRFTRKLLPFSWFLHKKPLLNFVIASLTACSLFFYFFLIRNMFTLGSFSDFQSLQNMFIPLLVVLLSIFIFKPAYKYVCKMINYDFSTEYVNGSHDEGQNSLSMDDYDTEIKEMNNQNDEDTIV